MLKANVAVIRWARKHLPLALTLVFVTGAALIFIALSTNIARPKAEAKIGGQRFALEVANTNSAREKGLSDREFLGSKQGMLFVFDKPDIYCFWMKDMRFDLDILWLDSSDHLVAIQHNLSPESYPNNFCPDSKSQYVIEVNAGTADKLNLHIGDTVKLENH